MAIGILQLQQHPSNERVADEIVAQKHLELIVFLPIMPCTQLCLQNYQGGKLLCGDESNLVRMRIETEASLEHLLQLLFSYPQLLEDGLECP